MSTEKTPPGRIVWRDLTVEDAPGIRDFYSQVVGWQARDHDMGDYADFDILPPDSDEVVAGICHARGSNASMPSQWLIYVSVEDVAASAERCQALGGKVLDGPRLMGTSPFCIVQDPAGAVLGLIQG